MEYRFEPAMQRLKFETSAGDLLEPAPLERRRRHRCIVALLTPSAQNAVGGFGDHFREQQPEVRSLGVVSGGDVFDTVGAGGELEAFPERLAGGILGVVSGDALAAAAALTHGEIRSFSSGSMSGTLARMASMSTDLPRAARSFK